MKKILGLDLGVGSIGWALISTENEQPHEIIAMGSRIVPLTKDDSNQFSKGQSITKNAERTTMRTARKVLDRYQLRRNFLTQVLSEHNMLPERMDENVFTLWKLRADAANPDCQLTLQQIGRVLYHLNQKRGYKHAKSDESADRKQTAYVAAVNGRYEELKSTGMTLGQYFYQKLEEGKIENEGQAYSTFRVKDLVYPRAAYMSEFDAIMNVQKTYYPEVLTDELIDTLRNRIIFYQRPLKSCKHLVSLCEFEMKSYTTKDGKVVYGGPKVAPRTSPLAEVCKIWESVNNLKLTNRNNEEYSFTLSERQALVDFMMNHEVLKLSDLQKILGITKRDGWYAGKAIGRGLQGNKTLVSLRKALEPLPDIEREKLLRFELVLVDGNQVDIETGESLKVVSEKVEQEPLHRLWHLVYSVADKDELAKGLEKQYGITDDDVVENLYRLDFVKPGYAGKSNKFMRRLLPYLQEGHMYSEACNYIGVNHSDLFTKEQNKARVLLANIPQLQKNELCQPIVEKILNQMINVVNALVNQYGPIDEIRVELARELKQSKDEREETDKRIRQNEKQNKEISDKIAEQGIRVSKSRIQKYKMWQETNHRCIYCGKVVNLADFLQGVDSEVEHIIPRSVLFDDSFSNKTCSCRECNQGKGNMTAYDFVSGRGQAKLGAYTQRVDELFQQKLISKTKRDHLLWKHSDIPQDFIDRQLRQTQYIAKKAVEILRQICRNVSATSGSVTDFLRHEWGYDEILHSLNYPRYKAVGFTEIKVRENNGVKQEKQLIKDWTKRMDHRRHAVDALTIALTRQGYIQRLNTLSADLGREEMYKEVNASTSVWNEKRSLLQKWISLQPHFSVQEVTEKVDGVLVSFRAGKRVTTPAKRAVYRKGKRIVVQDGLLVPRGALSKESVFGKIDGKYVIKYPLESLQTKDLPYIIDEGIRRLVEARLAAFGGNAKKAFAEPLYSDKAQTMRIKSVRCDACLSDATTAVVKRDEKGRPIGYVQPRNNHHIALYRDKAGKMHESVVTFWEAVNRKQHGIPVVIAKPSDVWTDLLDKDVPENLLEALPQDGWELIISMQVNEMFIMGMSEEAYRDAIEGNDYAKLNKHLYRVQKLSSGAYYFRHHTETSVDDKFSGVKSELMSKKMGKVIVSQSFDAFLKQNPHKVQINLLGQIIAHD